MQLSIGIAVALMGAVAAQASSEQIISDAQRPVWGSYGDIKVSRLSEPKAPGGTLVRISVPRAGANFWDSSATGAISKAVKKGDIVTIGFFARSGEPGKPAWVNAVVGSVTPPFKAAAVGRVELDDEIRFHCVEGISPVDVGDKQGRLTLHVAGAKQVVDLGPYMVTTRASGSETQLPCAGKVKSSAQATD
ncbi:hypothetical protein [Sphingomonas turrisvirgatae]|jgi:hypothetical protein|uniref:Uncharacterized protein n=1 Tax=Sphingomonas turrisvirgatae TaxID=1888892 RepID=A0A1E3LS52_9SPHN|nr:hypothetical protein [Sphingomonas turrisvirgatae]ODP36569.1 hypothetical protein BFL28_04420 [Sphingomonas turrisvirgatae]